MNQKVSYFALEGGEDLTSPPLIVRPGKLRYSKNYEPRRHGGYRRIDGYERYDGQPKPSAATFNTITFDVGSNEPDVDDVVTGNTSSATAVVAGYTITSGSWSGNDAIGTLAVHTVVGTFQNDELLTNTTQTNTIATEDGVLSAQVAASDTDYNLWIQAAIEWRRTQIITVGETGVTASGKIRGIWRFNGDVYSFRDNAGATAVVMWKATTAGWVAQNLGEYVDFTNGNHAANSWTVGETITGGTSGSTGVIERVVLTSGTYAAGNAVGRLYFHTLSAPFQAETITGGTSSVTGSIGGASTTITLPAGGRYEFKNYNFYGQGSSTTMYGVNGVGDPFQWNGTMMLPITTGISGIYATHINAHKNHLFLSFDSSILHSDLGDPFTFSGLGGSAEIAVGDDITGFGITPGDAIAVFSKDSTRILYGTSTDNWNLVEHSLNSGAREWTIQRLGTNRYLDDRGLTQLNAVDTFGDFAENTFSQYVDPLINTKINTELSSTIIREKDQYRIFFSDKTGLIARVPEGGKFPHFTRIEYPVTVEVTANTEASDGTEEIFFGSTDGYIYQMDSGTSFDGAAVEYSLRLPFNNLQSPRNYKRFFKVVLELDSDGVTSLSFAPDFSYGTTDRPKAVSQDFEVSAGGAYWDEADWAEFTWGGQSQGQAEGYIKGSGINMALLINGSATYETPHTVYGVTIQYAVRGNKR